MDMPLSPVSQTVPQQINSLEEFINKNGQSPIKSSTGSESSSTLDEQNCNSETTFRFVVINFSKMRDIAISPPSYVRNLPWRIMVMPRTNQSQSKVFTKGLGFYIQCNEESESNMWSCNAIGELRLLSHKSPKRHFSRPIQHVFNERENDWGFSHFINWSDILDPENDYLKNDTAIFEAWVSADAPHGMNWDSKRNTGFVGLKNQGATCYLNSLLQTLFFTNQLRNAVYHIPTDNDDSSSSVPLALQRVFYELQISDEPVGTKQLTKSFGWETLDSFMQHDVQELCRVLLDNLESKMIGSCVEETIPQLYQGRMVSFIRCKNVNYTSFRVETYYDIQLSVKGNKNIYQSFSDYCEIESMEGDNKYDAEEYGLQDAEKGIIFESFPPVLHLHLLRLQYDPITDSNVKINDKFEFTERLNLDLFLKNPEATPASYTLRAVLVHSGDNQGGHYVVFINPMEADGKPVEWCKFDDDVVACCSKQDALNYNFGGSEDEIPAQNSTNAYMLVYIRDSAISQVLQPVGEDSIPEHLKIRLEEEKRLKAIRKKDLEEAHLHMNVHLVTEDSFYGHKGNDLLDLNVAKFFSIKVRKDAKVKHAILMISEQMRYALPTIRIWPLNLRNNNTLRPCALTDKELDEEVSNMTEIDNPWIVFLERLNINSGLKSLPEFDTRYQVLVFFKFYNPQLKDIYYCGHGYLSKTSKVREVIPFANQLVGLPLDTNIILYEEIKPNMTSRLEDLDQSLEKAIQEILDGDIIVFQKIDPNMGEYDLPTVVDYFRDLFYRVEVIFINIAIAEDPGLVLELSLKMRYDQITKEVGKSLEVDPYLIQFYKTQNYRDMAGNPLTHTFEGTLKDILGLIKIHHPKKVFYRILTVRVDELENKKQYKLLWVSSNLKMVRELIVYPKKSGSIADLLEEVQKQVKLSEGGSKKLRLLALMNSRITNMFEKETPLNDLANLDTILYRAEEIPLEELTVNSDELLVPVAHFYENIFSTFGVPFFIKVKDGETFKHLKARIQNKLNITDKELKQFQFTIVQSRAQNFVEEEGNAIDLYSFMPNANISFRPWIGLEHLNKSTKGFIGYNYLDKSIKIHN